MLTWLSANIGTIIVSAILIAVITKVIVKLIKDKKKGKSSCGCGCSNCAMSGTCNSNIKR